MRSLLFFSLFLAATAAFSQALPANIDFETGTLSNWVYYTGTCCPISAGTVTTPVPGRHTLTSGTATDPYGGFPVVAPYAGSYSFKLGNDTGTQQSERVRYYVHVPSSASQYSLVYHYAAVLEDPGHMASDEPLMQITAFDSVTGLMLPCDSLTYIGYAVTPGFMTSPVSPGDVIYRAWTMGNVRMNGMGGHTVAIDFATGDCGLGGHFGYGYVDMSPGLFITSATVPCGGTTTLTAPFGYSTYTWYDSAAFTTVYGTSSVLTISAPHTPTKTYAVILAPYSGYGCPDTLYTRVTVVLPCPTLGIYPAAAAGEAIVAPNPALDEITITLGEKWYDAVSITNQVGAVVMEKLLTGKETKVDVSSLAPGVYFATMKGPNGRDVRRFVKM